MQPKAQKLHQHTQRVYVKVNAFFDKTGFMMSKSIIWDDGRVFVIDRVQDFRPASFFAISSRYKDENMPGDGELSEDDKFDADGFQDDEKFQDAEYDHSEYTPAEDDNFHSDTAASTDNSPATPSPDETLLCDCYTVIIQGKTKNLYFERLDPNLTVNFGRWFVKQVSYLDR